MEIIIGNNRRPDINISFPVYTEAGLDIDYPFDLNPQLPGLPIISPPEKAIILVLQGLRNTLQNFLHGEGSLRIEESYISNKILLDYEIYILPDSDESRANVLIVYSIRFVACDSDDPESASPASVTRIFSDLVSSLEMQLLITKQSLKRIYSVYQAECPLHRDYVQLVVNTRLIFEVYGANNQPTKSVACQCPQISSWFPRYCFNNSQES